MTTIHDQINNEGHIPATVPASAAILSRLLDDESNRLYLYPHLRWAALSLLDRLIGVDFDAAVQLIALGFVRQVGVCVYAASPQSLLNRIVKRERADEAEGEEPERWDGQS